jgi:uncharacterized repeat protein (TIGR01451 family)
LSANGEGFGLVPNECEQGDGFGDATINLAAGSTYPLEFADEFCCAEDLLFLRQLNVNATINGNGATISWVDGGDSAVFISSQADLSIFSLTLMGTPFEPAIYYDASGGTLYLDQVALLDNFGGIRLRDGIALVEQSLIVGQTSTGYGINVDFDATLTLVNSTITATGFGIDSQGTTTVSNSTLNENDDAIRAQDGTVTVGNTILRFSDGSNCITESVGLINSADFNIDNGNTCGFSGNNDLINTDALLGPLADNGGPTLTFLPLTGSPAIDGAGISNPNCPADDQRGFTRPQDGNGDTVASCDIGAVEVQLNNIDLTIVKQTNATVVFPGDPITFTLSVTNNGPAAAQAARVVDNVTSIGFGLVSWTCVASQGSSCSPTLNGAIDDTVQIAAGGSLLYTATTTADPGSTPFTINNTAQVIADPGLIESNPGNNSSSFSIQVISPDTFDLQISKTDGLANAAPGDVISIPSRYSMPALRPLSMPRSAISCLLSCWMPAGAVWIRSLAAAVVPEPATSLIL